MNSSLLNRHLFVRAIELGSIKLVAKEFGLTIEKTKRLLSDLELELKKSLYDKESKDFIPSKNGFKYFKKWRNAVHRLEVLGQKSSFSDHNSGFLRIVIPPTSGSTLFAGLTAQFLSNRPNLRVDLDLASGAFHPMWDGTDLRIVHDYYHMELVDQCLIGKIKRMSVCTPSYLKTHKPIKQPQDLNRPDILGERDALESGALHMTNGNEEITIPFHPQILIRNHLVSLNVALTGLGVAVGVPRYLAKPFIERGQLVEVLPQWKVPSLPIHAVMQPKEIRHPAIDELLEFFLSYFAKNEEPA